MAFPKETSQRKQNHSGWTLLVRLSGGLAFVETLRGNYIINKPPQVGPKILVQLLGVTIFLVQAGGVSQFSTIFAS